MKKTIRILQVVVTLGGFYSTMWITQSYTRNMPEAPQPELERTIPMDVNYGKTVYVNSSEIRTYNRVYTAGMLFFVGGMIFTYFQERKSARA